MAEKNSLWKNIREKAKQNKKTGATPKKPTKEMLDQEKKIKAQYAVGGPFNPDGGAIDPTKGTKVLNRDGVLIAPPLPEFEVALESNPYGPVSGEEFLESNFNPLNWVLPSVEKYDQQYNADGTFKPASGRIDPHYIELEMIKAKKSKEILDGFKDVDYEDFKNIDNTLHNSRKSISSVDDVITPEMSTKSEVDWAKWNKEMPENKALMQEYQAIEQEAKANGTWMKNPDGSPFVGTNPTAKELAFHNVNMTPEEAIKAQFIQQKSKNLKENMPDIMTNNDGTIKTNYHNSSNKFDSFNDNFFGKSDYGWYGKGVYTHPSRKYTASYGDNTYPLYLNSKNKGVIGKSNLENALYYGRTKEEIRDILSEDYNFMMKHNNVTGLLNSDIRDIPAIIKAGGYKKYTAKRFEPLIKRTDEQLEKVQTASLNDFTSLYNPMNQETVTPFANYPKSAIGNNGMFDMTNPNIYKAVVPAAVVGGAMQSSQPEQQAYGGPINPYMYYAGGPIQYKGGGALEDVGKLLVNTIAAPVEQISGNNFVNWDYNNKWAADAASVNEGLSFSHGGNITNNSVNLQSMKGRYSNHKNKYAKGGTFKKDLYDNPITSNIVNDPNLDRSYYDSRLDQIMLGSDYDQMDDYSKERTLAHENFHGKQYKTGNSTLLPTRTTYKEPSMVANDETYYGYHNRKFKDTEKVINKFKQENNSFNFVPDDVVYDKQGDAAQYFDMSTMEGEAKFYEDLGADISEDNKLTREFKYGGNMKKRFKKRFAQGGGLYDDGQGSQAVYGVANTVGAVAGVPGAGEILKVGDKINDGVAKLGNKAVQNTLDYTDQEMAIYNEGSKMVGNIPFIGASLGSGLDALNQLSGVTDKKISRFREQNRLRDVKRINTANDYSGYAQQAQVTFANGGDLSMLEGPSHAEGGIQLTPEAEVEGGETKKQDYIFSDRLIIPGKKTTFAQRSKQINKMYLGKRPNDPISKQAEERELSVLQDMQEIVRGEIMSNAYTKAYGGFLKKKKMYAGGNMPGPDGDPNSLDYITNTSNVMYSNEFPSYWDKNKAGLYENEFDTGFGNRPNNNINYIQPKTLNKKLPNPGPYFREFYGLNDLYELSATDMQTVMQPVLPVPNRGAMYAVSQSIPELAPKQIPDIMLPILYNEAKSKKFSDELSGTVEPLFLDTGKSSGDNTFGMQPADYASIGTQALSGLSQLYYGLKGPDEVRDAKFRTARPNKLNMTKAKRLASGEIDNSFSGVDYDLAQTASSAGNYAANRLASGIKRARVKAETNTKLSQEEELQNANIQNNFNQFNAQVLNAEEQINLGQEDKRIQEKDAARMAVTEGLNNIGQSVGQGVKDKRAYDWQNTLANDWMGTNNFVMDENGDRYFLNNKGEYVKINKKMKYKKG
jgi:hypothetical protein